MKQTTNSKMRSYTGFLSMCLLVSALLSGCDKSPQQQDGGKEIRFKAVTQAAPQTKTSYSSIKAGSPLKERINWEKGDLVRIYSDKAYCLMKEDQKWADYRIAYVVSPDPDNDTESWGEIVPVAVSGVAYHGGLQWADNNAHTFYAIYPTPATAGGTEFTLANAQIDAGMTIPATQTVTSRNVPDIDDPGSNIDVYYPNMSYAYMLGYFSIANPESSLEEDLPFEPAYTAFHIGFSVTNASTIKYVALESNDGTALNGGFSAAYSGGWTYDCTGATGTKVSTQELDIALTPGNYLEVELFALPQNIGELFLKIGIDNGAGGVLERTLPLKSAGSWIPITACHKIYLRGVVAPGAAWTITDASAVEVKENTIIAPWTDEDLPMQYGNTDPVINASKIAGNSGHYNFSVYAPKGQTWKIQVLDGIAGSPVSTVHITQNGNKNNGDPVNNEGNGTLTGEIGDPAKVDFTLGGGATGTFWLSFSVIVGGVEYSINSEVTANRTNTPMEITL